MNANMQQLALICKNGLPSFNIDKILLPIIVHRGDLTPAAFMKIYFQKSHDMYNRSAADTTFIQKCKEFALIFFLLVRILMYSSIRGNHP